MTTYLGDLVGSKIDAKQSTPLIAQALKGGMDQVLVRDSIALPSAAVSGDKISLGKFSSTAILDPASTIWFDDMGTSITLSVGDATTGNQLVNAADVATAAGSISLLKSVSNANLFKPLWQQLGLASNPGGKIELLATLAGGDPGAGEIAWQVKGQANK